MGTCRSCRKPVLWAQTVPGGKAIPLERDECDHDDHGALVLVHGWAYGLRDLAERLAKHEGTSTRAAEATIRFQYTAHLSHFAVCPHANAHRKAKR